MNLIRRVVTVDWKKTVEADGKALLLRTAQDGHRKIMADATSKGLAPSWTAYANTPGNGDLASVRLPGPIVYNYRYISNLINFALAELERSSPVQEGDYRRGHTLFVNGQAVEALPANIGAGDQIFIANLEPYARKIEIGKTESGRPFVIQVEPQVYRRVFEKVKAQARGSAKVSYGFIDVGSYALKRNQATRSFGPRGVRRSSRQLSDRVAGSAVKSPAIFFTTLV